ncbi:integrase core domain-containing protein [Bradyrhizobium sp.]|uniref:integrase core domain-containing protein n=1 Tax=Bradyrhizobium sp. TaxID=376 RepID=UPI0039C87C55
MSRPGNPFDNAKAESFMKTLKAEQINGKAFADLVDARATSTASSRRFTVKSACIRRSDTSRLLSSKLRSRKTKRGNAS